jgi:hypothetical protein
MIPGLRKEVGEVEGEKAKGAPHSEAQSKQRTRENIISVLVPGSPFP